MKPILYITGIFLLGLIGCTPSSSMYYWGDYSSTLYDSKKEPNVEHIKAHKDELVTIIEKSLKNNKRVPPGIHAEYGYYLLKDGNKQEGMNELDKEVQLYPESVTFINRIKQLYLRENK